ncbi:MAG: hypothetical protein RBS07_04080, partial [Lentimicrobium sp.]|nr:hypothetical protein [Lentimicrobium sp.]
GAGAWSIVSGGTGSFDDNTDPDAIFTANAYGTYVLRWSISNGFCTPSTADVTVNYYATPTTATVGVTQNHCGTITSTGLGGNTPAVGTGSWSISSGGTGTFTAPTAGNSNFVANAYGTYVLTWTISNGTCTPSTASITVNFYQTPTTATVGVSQSLCGTLTSASLGGNTPSAGTGTWSIVSGGTGTFSNSASGSSSFTADAYGTYVLRWTISNGTCTASSADVTVNFYPATVTSNAGENQELCNQASTTLEGNNPSPGTGLWTLVSGPNVPAITSPTAYNSTVTSMVPGVYVFKWTISSGTCTPSESTVTVTNYATPTTATAGADQTICGLTSTSLGGNTPVNGTGAWSIVSGGTGTFSNNVSGSSTFTANAYGTYTLRWTISNGECTASSDDISVTYYETPTTATVGSTQNLCGTLISTALGGNSPTAGAGAWSIVSGGTGSFDDNTDPDAIFTANAYGTYVLRWSISNGVCTPSTADVTVNYYQSISADAGSDQSLCAATSTVLIGNTPTSGTSGWLFVSGPNTPVVLPASGSMAIVNGMIASTTPYVFRYTITNGTCTSTDDVTVTNYNNPTPAFAGNDQTICSTLPATATMTANTPVYGSGAWTQESGTAATITNGSNPTTTITGLSSGAFTFRWTITNGVCAPSSDLVIINVGSPAIVEAGGNQTICEGTSATMAASASNYVSLLWTSSGTGTFANATIEDAVYSPSASDIANGSAILTLTATAQTGCPAVSDFMTLTINKAPLANAGSNALICQGSAHTLSGATASNYASILWTSDGTGSLTDETTLTPTYTPGAGETGIITLTLTAQPNTGCATAAVSTMTITINGSASAGAGDDATICESTTHTLSGSASNYASYIWTTSGSGTFSNTTTTLTPVYTPSAADIASGTVTLTLNVTANAPCGNVSDAMILTIQRQPVVDAGADATICASSPTYTLSSSTAINAPNLLWSSSSLPADAGSFDDATILHPVYTPSATEIAAGTVTLTLTASAPSACATATSSMVLTINASATASIGVAAATICEGSNYTLSAATVSNNNGLLWTTSGTGTFSNPAALNPVYTPSAADVNAGSITLTLTAYGNAPCGNATSTMTLTINKAPLANAGSNAIICQGSAHTVSGATASNYASILWTSDGTGSLTDETTLTPTYTPGAGETGIITLTLTAQPNTGCATAAVSTMTITINGSASAGAGDDATICESTTHTLSGSASNYASYIWTTSGTGTFSNTTTTLTPVYTPSAADIASGTVTLTLNVTANAPCGSVSDAMILTIQRQP